MCKINKLSEEQINEIAQRLDMGLYVTLINVEK